MSRKGSCYDNAPMESFWGKLKTEWLYGKRFNTREQVKQAIFEYIELILQPAKITLRKRLYSAIKTERHSMITKLIKMSSNLGFFVSTTAR